MGRSRQPLVEALQAMRRVEFVTAVTLVAAVGNFRRFAKAQDFMGYVGLIPSGQTSGDHRRQGPITKTGNAHVRQVLVEHEGEKLTFGPCRVCFPTRCDPSVPA